MTKTEENTAPKTVETTCFICHEKLAGDVMEEVSFERIPSITGAMCSHCHTAYCSGSHDKEMKVGWISGFKNSICLKCGQPMGNLHIVALARETETVDTSCFFCHKKLAGDVMDEVPFKRRLSITGAMCSHCHAAFCFDDHKKTLNFKLGSAYADSICPKCGQPMGLLNIVPSVLESTETEKEAEPVGYYKRISNLPKVCPNCGGSNVSAIAQPVMSTRRRIIEIVLGLFLIGIGYAMNTTDVSGVIVVTLLGYYFGFRFFWEGLMESPTPILGKFLITPKFEMQATCKD